MAPGARATQPDHWCATRQSHGHLVEDLSCPLRPLEEPGDLTNNQRTQLEWIAKTDPRLHRAYLLKEGLRFVFAVKGDEGKHALDRWLSWARRSRIQSFVELARKLVKHRAAIDHALDSGLSNGLIESMNTKIRLLTRIAFGFKTPTHSSLSPCSPSAVTHPSSQAETDPQIKQEGPNRDLNQGS